MDNQGMKFLPKYTKSKVFCSVYGCSSKACRDLDVRFHKFPNYKQNSVKIMNLNGIEEIIDRRVQWEKILRMGKK